LKAAIKVKPKQLQCVELQKPSVRNNEILIKVKSTGICGSDINRIASDDEKWNTVILGHEFSGIADEIGSDVYQFEKGDKIAVAPLVPCNNCSSCKKGNFSLCENYTFIGSRINGGFAEYVVVPVKNVIKIPDKLSFDKAAMLEPITVCLHSIGSVDQLIGKSVAILGAGTLGLILLQICKVMGVKQVVISDIVDEKLKIAEKLGANVCVNAKKNSVESIVKRQVEGNGVDLAIESSGHNSSRITAINITKGKGEIILLGTSSNDIKIEAEIFERIVRKEILLRGSWMSYSAPFPGDEWNIAIWLLEKGEVDVDLLATHKFPLEKIEKATDLIFNSNEMFCKVLINA